MDAAVQRKENDNTVNAAAKVTSEPQAQEESKNGAAAHLI